MKLKHILYVLMVLPFLWSCNNEDDVNEIFVSGTWSLVNFYTHAKWSSNNDKEAQPVYNPSIRPSDGDILKVIQKFTITFNDDQTFTATAQNLTFEGKWEADGKNRTISIRITNKPNASSYNRQYIDALSNACFYKGIGGSGGFLQLAPEDKDSFIQFKHN